MKTEKSLDMLPLAALAVGALALIAMVGLTGCSPAMSARAADEGASASAVEWQVFEDEVYGVRIQYPTDWTYEEIGVRCPASDCTVVRVVRFMPREWAARMKQGEALAAPLTLEISIGAMEEYRQVHAEPAASEKLRISGYAVTLERDVLGDARLARYVFRHPVEETFRVTLVDGVSGFLAEAEGDEDVIEALRQMLPTLEFTLIHPVVPEAPTM